ncbi:glycosyl transferase family 2 [Companilactobacillus sp. RD055328]|uniref:glycosyltransferase family 2 protein n=1 Tax=Companilactobacillus sp. RD055328 TaxID=2916634 RepID=UPI001FC8B7C0|nr:glycosyltransferase family 2 protein [Companilactobacillus sp. RD055328]GKQ43150.1 glycosyl transferase family 2 [Companilactobacillus sp. RD055328]
MTQPTVTVSIVTFNSKYIFKTLDSFISDVIDNFPVKIIVHDNGSDEKYLQRLNEYKSEAIQVVESTENLGFGHGHNQTLADVDTDYFLICNPDIIISRNAFEKMYNYLGESDENVAMLTPKIVGPNGEVQYLIRKKLDIFDYMLRFIPFGFVKKMFSKRLAAYECRDLDDSRQIIKYGSGAFMFTRTDVIKQIKGFDERFFMYFEDNDLCDKINHNGNTIMYIPDAVVTHFYGKESHRSFRGFKIFMKSMGQYFNKWGWRFF